MSYTPTEWKTGDVITAEKLNNMESGIVTANIMFATFNTEDGGNTFTCDKTVAEMKAFRDGGGMIYATEATDSGQLMPLNSITVNDNYTFAVFTTYIVLYGIGNATIKKKEFTVGRSEDADQDFVELETKSAMFNATIQNG